MNVKRGIHEILSAPKTGKIHGSGRGPIVQSIGKVLVVLPAIPIEPRRQQIGAVARHLGPDKDLGIDGDEEIDEGSRRRRPVGVLRPLEDVRPELKYLGPAVPQTLVAGPVEGPEVLHGDPVDIFLLAFRLEVGDGLFGSLTFQGLAIDGHENVLDGRIWPLFLDPIENVHQFEDLYVAADTVSLHVGLDAGMEGHVLDLLAASAVAAVAIVFGFGFVVRAFQGPEVFVDDLS